MREMGAESASETGALLPYERKSANQDGIATQKWR